MRVLFFFGLLIFSIKTYGQTIPIQILDSQNNPIALTTVQLLKDNKPISYGQSDKNGKLSLQTKGSAFPLQIFTTHLSYQQKSLTLYSTDSIVIHLEPKYTQMQEITITSDNYDVTRTKDTISYTLAKILNGSEVLLKDALEKLPGISIDDNKKILFQGRVIDHLLIDGSPFYGDNHQLATEHLKADILEAVQVLTNYKEKGEQNDFSTGKTAVNLQIKQEYKNKNNIELLGQGDFSKHYQGKGNLYGFHKKSKLSFLADINNINQSLFTPKDYKAILNKSGKALLNQSRASFFNNVKTPDFLNNDKDAKQKTHKAIALNYTIDYSEDRSLEIQGFMSYLNQQYHQQILQSFYLPQSPQTSQDQKSNQKASFTSFYMNYKNAKEQDFYWNLGAYYLGTNPRDLSFFNQLDFDLKTNSFIEQNNTNKEHSFGVNALLKYNFSKKSQAQILLFTDFSSVNSDLSLLSEKPLFIHESNALYLNQTNKKQLYSYGSKASFTHLFENASLSFELTALQDLQKGENANNLPSASLDKLHKNYYILGAYYNQKLFKNKITFNIGTDYLTNHNTLSQRSNTRYSVFLPYLKASFKHQDIALNIEMKKNLKSPDIDAFFQSDILQDYQSIFLGSTLNYKNIFTRSLQGNLSYGNPLKNTFALLAITYSKVKDPLGLKSQINNDVSTSYYGYFDFEKSSTLLLFLQKKSRVLPLGANLQVFYAQTQNTSSINSLDAITKTTFSKYDLFMQSYFKQSYFNIKAGIVLQGVKSHNQTKTASMLTNYTHLKPNVKIFGELLADKLVWEVKYEYNYYKTTNLKQDHFSDIGFEFSYKIKPEFHMFIQANNLLSLNKNKVMQSLNTTENYIQQRSILMLQGYLNLGAKLTF
ncbi:hypothetical protein [Myroides sp. LJL119]